MTERAKIGERRVFEYRGGAEYYAKQLFMGCDCPNCDEDGHWYNLSGTPDLKEARGWAEADELDWIIEDQVEDPPF